MAAVVVRGLPKVVSLAGKLQQPVAAFGRLTRLNRLSNNRAMKLLANSSKKGLSYTGQKIKQLFLKIKYPFYFSVGTSAVAYVAKKAPTAELMTVEEISEIIKTDSYEYGTLLKSISCLLYTSPSPRDRG